MNAGILGVQQFLPALAAAPPGTPGEAGRLAARPAVLQAAELVGMLRWSKADADMPATLALNHVAWLALVAVLLLFLIPYLLLGGLRRGFFYIVLLAASFALEGWLQEVAPGWFLLPDGSVGAWLSVAFALFAAALIFDWVYSTVTQPQRSYPHCQKLIAAEASYCPFCGQRQP